MNSIFLFCGLFVEDVVAVAGPDEDPAKVGMAAAIYMSP